MPGIFGIVDTSGRQPDRSDCELIELLQQMSAAMRYEPSYTAELVACPTLGAYAGRICFAAGSAGSETTAYPALAILTAGEPVFEKCETKRSAYARGHYGGFGGRELLQLYTHVGDDAFG